MSKIRSKNTKPEMLVRRLLWNAGFRYRIHQKDLPGNPDIVFRGKKKVIFVHGCFWHGHTCKHLPKTKTEFWTDKIKKNIARDLANIQLIKNLGWSVLIVWECELKDTKNLTKILDFAK